MSIDKVEVMNSQGDLLTLTLGDISNGYIVKDIDGLGPVKADIVTSDFATMEGQQFQASSRGARNITMQLGYAPNYANDETIWSLRDRLYEFFMTQTEVTMTFYLWSGRVVSISGMVETCDPPLFVKEPQMNISVLCFEPDFVDTELVELHDTFQTTDTTPHDVVVSGSVKTGLTSLRFTANKTLSGFTIYHTTPAGVLKTMLVNVPLILDDVVNLTTVKGQKSITRTRSSVTTSVLWAVSPTSKWVELERGTNQLYMNADVSGGVDVLVDYYNRYGAI